MDAASQGSTQFVARLQHLAVFAWYFLRSFRTTLILILGLALVILLGWLIPQETGSAGVAGRTAWVMAQPPAVQPWGDLLYFLGLARIFHSLWFWLPLALLFLNSLVALADLAPGSWRRRGPALPSLEWQHPLAHRTEGSVRLPETPDLFLTNLQAALVKRGFAINQPPANGERIVGASHRPRAWLGLPALYGSLILVILGLLVSFYFARSDRFTLLPLTPVESRLLAGRFELTGFNDGPGTGRVSFTQAGAQRELTWQLYLPALVRDVLVWPYAIEPVLTVEVRNQAGQRLKLIPVQENLAPAERLTLLRDTPGTPLYFAIPSPDIAVQIVPDPAAPDHGYSVRIRRGNELSPSAAIQAQAGEAFPIDGLSATLTPTYDLKVLAYRDPALLLYLPAAALALAALAAFLLPPRQIWLIPEIKGRGGPLYGVSEGLGPAARTDKLLAELLQPEEKTTQPAHSETAAPPSETPAG